MGQDGSGDDHLVFGIDEKNCTVSLNGKLLRLSNMEFRLLAWFIARPGVVVSAEEIHDALWGKEAAGEASTVQVHIHNLRRKIEVDPSQPKFLTSVKGKGYVFLPVTTQNH